MEAYRVLGSHIVDLVCAGGAERGEQPDLQPSLPKLFARAEAFLEAYVHGK